MDDYVQYQWLVYIGLNLSDTTLITPLFFKIMKSKG